MIPFILLGNMWNLTEQISDPCIENKQLMNVSFTVKSEIQQGLRIQPLTSPEHTQTQQYSEATSQKNHKHK